MTKSKKKQWSFVRWFIATFMICSGTIVLVWVILPSAITTPREKMQKELAKELGVEIQDYPYPYSFPSGYFHTVLRPGMPITEVHEIVQGYKQVLRCGDKAEMYYYLSTELEDTERFTIIYDENRKYKEIRAEDNDSPGFSTNGCSQGLINE